MNATPDLFAPPAPPVIQADLRASSSWEVWAKTPGVHLSFCGRYSIVRSDEPVRRWLAFRRYGSIETRDWNPPTLLGAFERSAAARRACAEHAEANP